MKNFVANKLDISNEEVVLYKINFNSSYEIIDYINSTKDIFPWTKNHPLSSHRTNMSMYGTDTFEEAIELFRQGDKKNIPKFLDIKTKINDLMPYLSKNRDTKYYVYGSRPNIPRYLTQNPNCMHKLKREELNNIINIYYNVSSDYGTSNTTIERRGMFILSITEILEKMGYRVNLVFYDLNKCGNEFILIKLNIKDGMQVLDPNICFFPLCHPSYSRRIMTAVMEKCPVNNEMWPAGYGDPVKNKETISQIFNITNKDICITDSYDKNNNNSLIEDMELFLKDIDFNRFLDKGKEIVFDTNINKFVIKNKVPLIEKNTPIENNTNKVLSKIKKERRSWK